MQNKLAPMVLRAVSLALLAIAADGRAQLLSDAPSAVYSGRSGDATSAVDYSVNADAAQLIVEVSRNGVPADGQSPVQVTLRVLGADGKPLANRVYATLETTGGRILLDHAKTDEAGPGALDADRATPGVQLAVEQGVAHFQLLAPIAPQDVQLRVTVGAQEATGTVRFVPDMRQMIAAGLIEGVINFSGTGSLLNPTHSNDGFDAEIQHFSTVLGDGEASVGARSAFFLKGVIKGEYLLTASYDSDKDVQSRLITDIKPDAFYPVYGDASLQGSDVKSATALYVRIDKDKNYLLYGDFSTGDGFSQRRGDGAVASLQQRSLGAFNRTATGVRGHVENDTVTANAFAINDTLRQVVQEFASQGSGPYGLSNSGAVQNSETVEVLVRDRNMPSRILSTRALLALTDYTFEPFSGRLLLNQFLPSVDASLNPVSLRITYSVDQGGNAFWVLGADGQWRMNDSLELGGAALQDQNPYAGSQLASANLTWRLAPKTSVVAEVAQTITSVNTNPLNQSALTGMSGLSGDIAGQAWRVEMAHTGEQTEARVFVGQSDPTFANLASPLTGGKSEAMVQGAYRLNDTTRLYVQAQRDSDRNPGMATSEDGRVGVKMQLTPRLTLDAGLRTVRESEGIISATSAAAFSSTSGLTSSLASGSGGGLVGYGNQAIDPSTGLVSVSADSLLATSTVTQTVPTRSDTARIGLGYKATEKLTLGGEVESAVSGDPLQRYALGGDYLVAERTRLYLRAETQAGSVTPAGLATPTSSSNAVVFGASTSYWKDTQLFSEYRMRDAISSEGTQLASGVRNVWDLQPGLRASAAYEWTQVLTGVSPTTQAISGGLDFTGDPLWRGSTRLEYRVSGDVPGATTSQAFNTVLWEVMAARKISRDWTFLSRNYLLQTRYDAHGGVLQDRIQVGTAYRDTDTNRINALAKYEYKTERDDSDATTGSLYSNAHIVSVLADYHPSRPWWTTGRAAAKWQEDQFEGGVQDRFNAVLVSGRVNYDITENWDLSVLLAQQTGQYGARQFAQGAEVGYLVQQNLWISAGYNFAGFSADSDLAGNDYTREGIYIRLRFKFDQDLFSGNNATINRALDR